MESARHNQHSGAEFIKRHKHLLGSLRLGHNAHLVFNRENFGDPRPENCLVVCQNQFEHWRFTSRLRLANKIISINYTSHTLRLTTAAVLAHHASAALHDHI